MLLVIVAIAAAVTWLLVAQPWAGAASEGNTPTGTTQTQQTASSLPVPSSEPSASATTTSEASTTAAEDAVTTAPSPSATPAAQPCVAGDIAVEAVTDQDTYSADQQPALSIKLTNTGTSDCTINVGTSGQSFTVTSGSDTWWRSTDCQSEPSDMVVLITAGQTVSSAAPLMWDRTRSAIGTCGDQTRPRAPGGGSSYHLMVEIGGIPSTESAQFLLY